jgi:hypothetical protein
LVERGPQVGKIPFFILQEMAYSLSPPEPGRSDSGSFFLLEWNSEGCPTASAGPLRSLQHEAWASVWPPGGEGARPVQGTSLPVVWRLGLPLDSWSAHSGLFAHCLAFVQPFNSLHQLEHKHRPAAEMASLGRHSTVQGLSCLEMGADGAKIVNISFPLHYPDPCRCGWDGEF